MPHHDELCEQNDTDKLAIIYRRPDKSGHCVVWDEQEQKRRGVGYLDFQATGNPIPAEKEHAGWIDDMAEHYFLFKRR